MPATSFYHQERQRERAFTSRGDYSVEHYDLNDDKAMVKMQREQRKRVDKENRARRGRDLDDREAELDSLNHFPEKKRSSRRAEGLEAYSGSASHSEKVNLKSKPIPVKHMFICLVPFLFSRVPNSGHLNSFSSRENLFSNFGLLVIFMVVRFCFCFLRCFLSLC